MPSHWPLIVRFGNMDKAGTLRRACSLAERSGAERSGFRFAARCILLKLTSELLLRAQRGRWSNCSDRASSGSCSKEERPSPDLHAFRGEWRWRALTGPSVFVLQAHIAQIFLHTRNISCCGAAVVPAIQATRSIFSGAKFQIAGPSAISRQLRNWLLSAYFVEKLLLDCGLNC